MRQKPPLLTICLLALALSAYLTAPAMRSASARATAEPTLDAMIGQMLMLGFEGTSPDAAGSRRMRRLAAEGKIGGVILMDRNIRSPAQTRALVASIRGDLAGPGLFVAVDQEGGLVQRLSSRKGFNAYPTASTVARLYAPERARQVYETMARELAAAGFNMNFGPVVDLNLNRTNPIIGRLGRSYGSDPDKVTQYARAFVDAHRAYGIVTAAKHFPGHGSSWGDSHEEFIDLSKTWKEVELSPYRQLAGSGSMDMVMIGHLYHPAFSGGKRLPATLSPTAIDGWVRDRLGFSGVVITDDMEMGAIKRYHSLNAAAVMAVNSGNDILLYSNAGRDPQFAEKLITTIRQAVESGQIPRSRIETAYARIMRLRESMRVVQASLPEVATVGTIPPPVLSEAVPAQRAAPLPAASAPPPEPEERRGLLRRLRDYF
ncbi:MAG: glycoside hydrolase family 3 protein [Pseudomonadota bacterium]|nr:glycoside hydrolase family 3 protein [Pseudomonadota bacterium]